MKLPFPKFRRKPASTDKPKTELERLGEMRWRSPQQQHRYTTLKRLHDHVNACIQAYRAKGLMVRAGKGRNTLTGIPQEWVS